MSYLTLNIIFVEVLAFNAKSDVCVLNRSFFAYGALQGNRKVHSVDGQMEENSQGSGIPRGVQGQSNKAGKSSVYSASEAYSMF